MRRHPALPALLLATLLLLPFVNKAFTIDDTLFLLQARHLLSDPLHPTAFEVVWGEVPARMSAMMPSGPVMAYLLLPAALLGGAEWLAHLVQWLMLCVGIIATVSLGARLAPVTASTIAPVAAPDLRRRTSVLSGLLLAATPAVLGMAGTSMPDIPAMSLGALGIERTLAFRQEHRAHQALLAAVALGLAMLSRSHLLLLWPLGMLALHGGVWERRALQGVLRHLWLPVLSLLLVALCTLLTGDPERGGRGISGSAQRFLTWRFLDRNLPAFCGYWVLSMPLGLVWASLRWQRVPFRLLGLCALLLAPVLVLQGQARTLWVAPLIALGGWVLHDILRDAWERRDEVQQLLGLWLLCAAPVACYIHMAPKYLLASAPAMAVLLARRLVLLPLPACRRITGAALALGMVLGVLILRADQRFSGLSRQAAQVLIAPRVQRGERVWFAGHWGFHYYAERAGARCLTRTPPYPVPGDLIVSSEQSQGQVLSFFPHPGRPIEVLSDRTPGGRIMSPRDGAGFYSTGWGYLPWTYGTGEIDRFTVWRVE